MILCATLLILRGIPELRVDVRSCALQDPILIQGHFWISVSECLPVCTFPQTTPHTESLSFASNLPGLKRRVILPFDQITAINKETVLLLPTAISVDCGGQHVRSVPKFQRRLTTLAARFCVATKPRLGL
jgi:hypothetical protein